MRFKRHQRLKTAADFQTIKSQGSRIDGGPFLFCIRPLNDGLTTPLRRLGLIVSRKVGNAVVRNHTKRLLREIFRKYNNHLLFRCDLVIIAKPHIINYGLDSLTDRFLDCCKRFTKEKK